jgi:hypothetical protein
MPNAVVAVLEKLSTGVAEVVPFESKLKAGVDDVEAPKVKGVEVAPLEAVKENDLGEVASGLADAPNSKAGAALVSFDSPPKLNPEEAEAPKVKGALFLSWAGAGALLSAAGAAPKTNPVDGASEVILDEAPKVKGVAVLGPFVRGLEVEAGTGAGAGAGAGAVAPKTNAEPVPLEGPPKVKGDELAFLSPSLSFSFSFSATAGNAGEAPKLKIEPELFAVEGNANLVSAPLGVAVLPPSTIVEEDGGKSQFDLLSESFPFSVVLAAAGTLVKDMREGATLLTDSATLGIGAGAEALRLIKDPLLDLVAVELSRPAFTEDRMSSLVSKTLVVLVLLLLALLTADPDPSILVAELLVPVVVVIGEGDSIALVTLLMFFAYFTYWSKRGVQSESD